MADADYTNEKWLPVVGYEGCYEVSSLGNVRSVDRLIEYADGRSYVRKGQPMRQTRSNGYHYTVRLSVGGRSRNHYVHKLVAAAFLGQRPDGLHILHENDDPSDNRVENLRYGSQSDNMNDLVKNGNHHFAKRDRCSWGHEYTPENTYPMPGGGRKCRECKRREGREYQRRKRRQSA